MKRNAFIKDVLEKWNIQSYVMASLLFQMILVFLAPMRRWVNNGFMYLVIWAVYLLANFFSTFALSLIYNNAPKEVNESDIFPFWAPFLLVHLGGPHTITALAMEDNNLWHRHLLAQLVQVFSVLVVFYQYQIFQSEWLLPTAIVFFIGIVKCFERISSLQLASFNFVRRSIRQKLDKGGGGGEDYSRKPAAKTCNDVVDKYEIVRRGYEFYKTFKGFIIDHTFIQNECGKEKECFSKLGEEDAFKVMEMELNFMYQAMFTKMIAVQYWENNYFWCIWRFVCHALLEAVAIIFFCHSKHHLQPTDIAVTYCLLGGAVLLDQIAIIHLIFSHWTMVKIMDSDYYKNATAARNKILRVINGGLKVFTVNKCWSRTMIQYSLVNHSLTGRWKCVEPKLDVFSLKEVIDSCLHTTTAKVGPRLKKLVVEDIKRKAKIKYEDDVGNNHQGSVMDIILPLVQGHTSDYATCVLILHVATEICYFTRGEGETHEDAKLCIQISQYLAYLLVLEGRITSALPGTIGMRFKDICWEQVDHTFDHLYYTFNPKNAGIWCRKRTSRQKACEYLADEKLSNWNDEELENNNNNMYKKSVLPKAVKLAKAMNTRCGEDNDSILLESAVDPEGGHKKQQEEFWRSLSEVWVGLLVYASSHCRGDVYYLNKGGQFYTFVRLLMAHFGLEENLKGERSFQLQDEIIHY